jgi:hypothetical protein
MSEIVSDFFSVPVWAWLLAPVAFVIGNVWCFVWLGVGVDLLAVLMGSWASIELFKRLNKRAGSRVQARRVTSYLFSALAWFVVVGFVAGLGGSVVDSVSSCGL